LALFFVSLRTAKKFLILGLLNFLLQLYLEFREFSTPRFLGLRCGWEFDLKLGSG